MRCTQVNRVKSSTMERKKTESFIDGVAIGPQMSQWTISKRHTSMSSVYRKMNFMLFSQRANRTNVFIKTGNFREIMM
jgi:hypothetical protein